MADLDQFSRNIKILGVRVTENVDKAMRTIALAIDQAVVTATPVDTGRARSNWLVSLEEPSENEIEPYVEGEKGSTGNENISAALAQGRDVVDKYGPGDTIFITNNLPYIQQLNAGSSSQAPAGFVEQAVDAAAAAVGNVTILDQ